MFITVYFRTAKPNQKSLIQSQVVIKWRSFGLLCDWETHAKCSEIHMLLVLHTIRRRSMSKHTW